MTSWDDVCNADYKRFHHGRKAELPKSQWRPVNTKVHPELYQRMYRLAGTAKETLCEWLNEAIRQRVERDESSQ